MLSNQTHFAQGQLLAYIRMISTIKSIWYSSCRHFLTCSNKFENFLIQLASSPTPACSQKIDLQEKVATPKSYQNGQVIAKLVKVASSGSQPTSSIITVQKAQRQVNFLSNFYAREYQLKQELTKTNNAFFARKTLQILID